MAVTITEALAELKTLDKRLEAKRASVSTYLFRQEGAKDPLERDGGSPTYVSRERQAIRDLEERKVKIRRAISSANDRTTVTVAGETRSVAEWLTWRRDVAPGKKAFLARMQQQINQVRQQALQKGIQVVQPGQEAKYTDFVVNLSEKELTAEAERLEEALGVLDGQLSLKNATVTVDA